MADEKENWKADDEEEMDDTVTPKIQLESMF
jgi:hypothetical protein